MRTINILIKGEDGKEVSREVKAYATKSRYIFVNREVYRGEEIDLWTITHEPTGLAIVQGIKTRRAALKACNDYFSTCTGWETLTNDNVVEFYRINHEALNSGRNIALEI